MDLTFTKLGQLPGNKLLVTRLNPYMLTFYIYTSNKNAEKTMLSRKKYQVNGEEWIAAWNVNGEEWIAAWNVIRSYNLNSTFIGTCSDRSHFFAIMIQNFI